jgi:hypothetical protein
MEVPCPVPLQQPWSPVGYQVIEENVPTVPGAATRPTAEPAWQPSSPLGYRVVVVAAEHTAQPAPRPLLHRLPARTPKTPQRQRPPFILWASCAAGGALVLALMIGIILVRMATATPDRPVALDTPHLPRVNVPEAPAPKAKPPVDNDAPAPVQAKPVALDGPVNLAGIAPNEEAPPAIACKVAPRDTFGTTIAFARNPMEANRAATHERKLTFHLHVSGNFEEERFT